MGVGASVPAAGSTVITGPDQEHRRPSSTDSSSSSKDNRCNECEAAMTTSTRDEGVEANMGSDNSDLSPPVSSSNSSDAGTSDRGSKNKRGTSFTEHVLSSDGGGSRSRASSLSPTDEVTAESRVDYDPSEERQPQQQQGQSLSMSIPFDAISGVCHLADGGCSR